VANGSFGGGLAFLYCANGATTLAQGMTLTDTGRVGIGVTNPQVLLAAVGTCTLGTGAGTTTAAYHTGMVNIIGGSTRALLRIENNNSVGSPGIIFGEGGGFTEDTQPTIKKVQGTNNLAIMCGGNVGIGNTTPPVKLWVPATSTTTGIGVYNSDVAIIIGNAAGGTNAGSIQVKSAGSSSAIGATNYTLALNPDGGNVGIGTASPSVKLDIVGALKTSTNSTNYVVGTGVAVTINSTTPTTVASATLTTNGKPIFVMCSGDLQPVNNLNDWCFIRLFRDSTAIGNLQIDHPNTNPSANEVFAIHAIDVPGAGTYTYSCKAWQGNGNIQFGEVGVPYLTAYEFI